MHMCVSGEGPGQAAAQRVGVVPGEEPGTWVIRHNGDFAIPLVPGRYTAIAAQPLFFPPGQVFRDLVIAEGETVTARLELPVDYAVVGGVTGVWGRRIAQSFVARGPCLTRVAVRPAGVEGEEGRIAVRIREGSASGEVISPVRRARIAPLADAFVSYLHGEVTTTPGKAYVAELEAVDEAGRPAARGWIPLGADGGTYAEGTGYVDGRPVPFDFHLVIGSERDGVAHTYGRVTGSDFKMLLRDGWSHEWGQTFRATGEGLAGVNWLATTGFGKHFLLEAALCGEPGGPPVGPPKRVHCASDLPYGVSWAPGEVAMEPGRTYYLRLRGVDADDAGAEPGFNVYRLPEDSYRHGSAWTLGAAGEPEALAAEDLDVDLYEYTFQAPPPDGPEASPPRAAQVVGRVRVANGGFEDTGADEVPVGWQRWRSADRRWREPAYWNRRELGRGGGRSARIIGGTINGHTFDGGLVCVVDGLVAGRDYVLTAWVCAGKGTSASRAAYLGVDATGQAGDPGRARWTVLPASGGWQQFAAAPFRAAGGRASVWLRACLYSLDDGTYWADFDDVEVWEVRGTAAP